MSAKRIKALKVRGWKIEHVRIDGPSIHYVLPATADAYEQMIKQASNDLSNADANDRCSYDEMVRAVAKSWGITPPKKGRTP